MPLEYVDLPRKNGDLPPDVAKFIEDADARVSAFFDRVGRRIPRFIPSDSVAVYHALSGVAAQNLAPGNLFLEWGSGFGIAACLAAMLGFEAYGIEMEDVLVEASRELARDYDLPVEIACADFMPDGYEVSGDPIGGSSSLMKSLSLPSEFKGQGHALVEAFDLNIDDFDVIYIYPWPGEMEMIEDLFDQTAGEESLLVMYDESDGCTVRRRTEGDTEEE